MFSKKSYFNDKIMDDKMIPPPTHFFIMFTNIFVSAELAIIFFKDKKDPKVLVGDYFVNNYGKQQKLNSKPAGPY